MFIDLFSRKIVGLDLSESFERYSIIRALHKAIMNSKQGEGFMIHSDRGYSTPAEISDQLLKAGNSFRA